MMAKLTKSLELHYPMIQFLIIGVLIKRSLTGTDSIMTEAFMAQSLKVTVRISMYYVS